MFSALKSKTTRFFQKADPQELQIEKSFLEIRDTFAEHRQIQDDLVEKGYQDDVLNNMSTIQRDDLYRMCRDIAITHNGLTAARLAQKREKDDSHTRRIELQGTPTTVHAMTTSDYTEFCEKLQINLGQPFAHVGREIGRTTLSVEIHNLSYSDNEDDNELSASKRMLDALQRTPAFNAKFARKLQQVALTKYKKHVEKRFALQQALSHAPHLEDVTATFQILENMLKEPLTFETFQIVRTVTRILDRAAFFEGPTPAAKFLTFIHAKDVKRSDHVDKLKSALESLPTERADFIIVY